MIKYWRFFFASQEIDIMTRLWRMVCERAAYTLYSSLRT